MGASSAVGVSGHQQRRGTNPLSRQQQLPLSFVPPMPVAEPLAPVVSEIQSVDIEVAIAERVARNRSAALAKRAARRSATLLSIPNPPTGPQVPQTSEVADGGAGGADDYVVGQLDSVQPVTAGTGGDGDSETDDIADGGVAVNSGGGPEAATASALALAAAAEADNAAGTNLAVGGVHEPVPDVD